MLVGVVVGGVAIVSGGEATAGTCDVLVLVEVVAGELVLVVVRWGSSKDGTEAETEGESKGKGEVDDPDVHDSSSRGTNFICCVRGSEGIMRGATATPKSNNHPMTM